MRAVLWLLLGVMTIGVVSKLLPAQPSDRRLAIVTEIADEGVAKVEQPPIDAYNVVHSRIHSFSPRLPLDIRYAGLVSNELSKPLGDDGSSWGDGMQPAVSPGPAANPLPAISWPERSEVLPAAHVVLSDASAAPDQQQGQFDAATIDRLTRDLQRELKRVGCYAGEIDGDWGPASKRGMSAFTSRVNATLPVDQPDNILLTLVMGHTGQACGLDCPAGLTADTSGRCIPQAILAHGGTAVTRPWAARVVASSSNEPAQARLHEARTSPAPVVVYAQRPSATVLPGRMAVGAPVSIVSASPASTDSVAGPAPSIHRSPQEASPRAKRVSARREARAAPRTYRSRSSRAWTATFFDRY